MAKFYLNAFYMFCCSKEIKTSGKLCYGTCWQFLCNQDKIINNDWR